MSFSIFLFSDNGLTQEVFIMVKTEIIIINIDYESTKAKTLMKLLCFVFFKKHGV